MNDFSLPVFLQSLRPVTVLASLAIEAQVNVYDRNMDGSCSKQVLSISDFFVDSSKNESFKVFC